MNKELVRKVLDKGFKAKTLTTVMIDNSVLYPDKCPEVSNEVSWFLWLCEVQKWMRENHYLEILFNVYRVGDPIIGASYGSYVFHQIEGRKSKDLAHWTTYEKALELGIEAAIENEI